MEWRRPYRPNLESWSGGDPAPHPPSLGGCGFRVGHRKASAARCRRSGLDRAHVRNRAHPPRGPRPAHGDGDLARRQWLFRDLGALGRAHRSREGPCRSGSCHLVQKRLSASGWVLDRSDSRSVQTGRARGVGACGGDASPRGWNPCGGGCGSDAAPRGEDPYGGESGGPPGTGDVAAEARCGVAGSPGSFSREPRSYRQGAAKASRFREFRGSSPGGSAPRSHLGMGGASVADLLGEGRLGARGSPGGPRRTRGRQRLSRGVWSLERVCGPLRRRNTRGVELFRRDDTKGPGALGDHLGHGTGRIAGPATATCS